ncbi:MAG: sigW 7 [Planctomycetaceae bacterium]|nr:sigW 7 [Planctomycetaceae bacterium]
MLAIRYLMVLLILGTVAGGSYIFADDPAVPATQPSTQADVPAQTGPAPTAVDAILEVMKAAEKEGDQEGATVVEQEVAKRYRALRALIEMGSIQNVKAELNRMPETRHGTFAVIQWLTQNSSRPDMDGRIRSEEFRQGAAKTAQHKSREALRVMDLEEYLAWAAFQKALRVSTSQPDPTSIAELTPIVAAERLPRPLPHTGDLKLIVDQFNQKLQTGELNGLGSLVAKAMRKRPDSAEVERMKLRLVFRLSLNQNPRFMNDENAVSQLASQFTSAARRRMALGEYESARLLATDAIPLNTHKVVDSDSPSQVLANIQLIQATNQQTAVLEVDPSLEYAPDVSPNLLRNSSLEEGENAPANWQQGTAVTGVEFIWDKKNGHTGKSSLALSKTAKRYFPIADWHQTVEWNGNSSKLRVSAQVKAEVLTKAVLDVAFLDENDKWLEHKWAAYIGETDNGPPITHDWKKYQGDVDVPPGTKKIQIGLQIYGPGKVWFDDVSASVIADVNQLPQPASQYDSALPPNQPLGRLQLAVPRDRTKEVMSLVKAEFESRPGEKVTLDSEPLGDSAEVVNVKGPLYRLEQVSEFVLGIQRLYQYQADVSRKPDEEDLKLDRETRELAARVRAASGAEREKLKSDFENLISKQFKHRQNRRKIEIEDLSRRVEQMRKRHLRRDEQQTEILKARVKDLLDEDRDLKWDEAQRKPSLKPGVQESLSLQKSGFFGSAVKPGTAIVERDVAPIDSTTEDSLASPTYDGISYSAWLKTLESERNPKKVFEAVKALKEMPQAGDAARLAKGFIRAVRLLPLDGMEAIKVSHSPEFMSVIKALCVLPVEPVVAALMDEIRSGLKSEGSRLLTRYLLVLPFENREVDPQLSELTRLSKPMSLHAKQLLELIIELKALPDTTIVDIAIKLLLGSHLKPVEVSGLSPVIANVLKEHQKLKDDEGQAEISLSIEIAKIDSEFPGVKSAISEFTKRLRQRWDGLQMTTDAQLAERQVQIHLPGGKTTQCPCEIFWIESMISELGQIGTPAREAVPLLKEIQATNLSTTKPFQKLIREIRDRFQREVTTALENIERK